MYNENDKQLFLQCILNSENIGIIELDNKLNINLINNGISMMFDYLKDDLIKKSISILFDSDNYYKLDNMIKNNNLIFNELTNDRNDFYGLRKDKTTFPIEITMIKDNFNDKKIYILIIRDISEIKQTMNDLQYLAFFDQLTEIPNRTLFLDRAETAIRQAKRENYNLAIIYIDLDEFKNINDELGHEAGDRFLKEISRRYNECIRESDTLSRFGGDEFTILMPKVSDIKDASRLALRILNSNTDAVLLNNKNIYPKTSLGISIFPNDGEENLISVIIG